MKGIILAAGYATRLYPLTLDRPKPLLEIAGKPIISHITQQMAQIDELSEIIVVTNHKFVEHFRRWQQEFKCTKPIVILDDKTTSEETRLGAIGDIQFTIEQQGIDEDLMIIAGDSFFDFNLHDFYDYYKSIDKDCVVVKENDDIELLRAVAVVKLDDNGKIVSLVEKPEHPESNLVNFASYIYTRESVARFAQYLADGNKPDAPGYFVQWLYKIADVYGYKIDGEYYDIGTKKALDYVNEIMAGKA
ncbi:MAG: nucleotidyltransferase family protein [Defluviitaleaceae bacterium]|nr:nucleotidyltransferase family protein [Defluviitaleaceae bacterium]